jgi:ATP-dependent DNA helicase RecG
MHHLDWMKIKDLNMDLWEKVPGWPAKGTQFIGKKGLYLLQILILCLETSSMDELLITLEYNNRGSFRNRYLLPLLAEGLIERTLPDKPSSKLQRYRTTIKGRLFLGGNRIK